MESHGQRQRFVQACILVCSVMAAVCVALGATARASGAGGTSGDLSRTVFQAVMEGATLESAMAAAGFTADAAALPSWFTQEVLDADALEEWYASSGFEAVFVSVSSDPRGVEGARVHLQERGWCVAADDGEGVLSLMKGEGMCRWMTASIREVPNGWEAVLHIQRASSATNEGSSVGDGS